MGNIVSQATQAAIKRAKSQDKAEVDQDDLLVGLLQTISRFNIVKLGSITIDLEDFEDTSVYDEKGKSLKSVTKKVAYSASANAIFEKAAMISRSDKCTTVRGVHLLVAFADQK